MFGVRTASFIIFFFLVASTIGYAEKVAVVGASGIELTKSDIKSIYLGFKKTLPDGTPAHPLSLKGNGVKEKFMKTILGISSSDFKAHWLTKALEGEGVPPPELTVEEIIERVKREKGAIGIVPSEKAKDVNVLMVIE